MPSPAKAPAERPSDSAANLDFYRTRDEFVRAYQPATPEEQLLVTQITRTWQHLQDVYDLRDRLTSQKGLLGLFEESFDKYKLLMRNLTEAERMWRYAVQEFQRARRRRDPLASPRVANLTAVPSVRPRSTQPLHARVETAPSGPARSSTDSSATNEFEEPLQI